MNEDFIGIANQAVEQCQTGFVSVGNYTWPQRALAQPHDVFRALELHIINIPEARILLDIDTELGKLEKDNNEK